MNNLQFTYTRKRAKLGALSSNQISYTNPWVIMTWSFFFPGFGHILLGEYIQGWILFSWELFVNVKANFNTAILFAFTGRFAESIELLKAGGHFWILLYGAVFIYSLYGCYLLSVETNNLYTLAYEENAPIQAFTINSFQYNFFPKRNPCCAALWTLLMPGLGEMYTRKITSSIFVLGWWMIMAYLSHDLAAIEYTFTGHFDKAKSVLNKEWYLFLPSIYGFTFYNSYVSVVEQGKLFDKLQSNFLRSKYQSCTFPFLIKKEEKKMRIISTFDHSIYLEKAIAAIERQGIPKEQIFAVPINKNKESYSLSLDSTHRSDGKSFLDVPALLGSFCCALGCMYGFVLYWGPVLWGMIGFVGGVMIGCIIKIIIIKLSANMKRKHSKTEVVLMIDCKKEMAAKIEHILWKNQAFGVSKV